MAKRKEKKIIAARPQLGDNVEILSAGEVLESPITDTLETNYMPYAMSVIVSRALPEIDGFKPAHRKVLYTMYDMGLLKGNRTKSANIVGSTMHLNPHGDQAIYDTMVRLARGNESLLVPFVSGKGNFGKAYSRDMAYAASRYTEAKLEEVCNELFRDIDKDTVDFVDNYDATTQEPTLLPVTFPTILANNTLGIAVGMASSICSFNLAELCETTIALLKNPDHDIRSTLPAPDFVGGGYILCSLSRDGTQLTYSPSMGMTMKECLALLEQAKPVFTVLPGWKTDIRGVTDYQALPVNAKAYVDFIEKEIETPIHIVSTGPKRHEITRR